jgi:hypothetical protein
MAIDDDKKPANTLKHDGPKSPCGCGGVSSARPESGGVAEGGVNSPCHGFTGGVTSHQGHVVPNPQIVLIYWDPGFGAGTAATTSMDQFVSDLAAGGYWDGLSQYGVGTVSFLGSVVIDVTAYPTPNTQNPGQVFSESQRTAGRHDIAVVHSQGKCIQTVAVNFTLNCFKKIGLTLDSSRGLGENGRAG